MRSALCVTAKLRPNDRDGSLGSFRACASRFRCSHSAPDISLHRGEPTKGHGTVIAIPRGVAACPVAALKAWLDAARITAGPVFRPIAKGARVQDSRLSDRSVANIVKAHAARVGLDRAQFAGHSLRSGFLTSAAGRGASIFKMADHSRHRSMDTLRGYVRDSEMFRNHAGDGLL